MEVANLITNNSTTFEKFCHTVLLLKFSCNVVFKKYNFLNRQYRAGDRAGAKLIKRWSCSQSQKKCGEGAKIRIKVEPCSQTTKKGGTVAETK